ncbi:class F sortase [Solwaraspora sp. WMMD791]|uniref:class F sortase n=1 Tax=Solwaraspora sp. WMMD791 TaxID=3016086 RepID=UPI00249CB0EE|nr:class F sortase [Solwaraspora sp. WMMD791]WFE29043.1 class F sortase [Solwaraspora sp. WMMD791]
MAKGGRRNWTGPVALLLGLFGVFMIAFGDGSWREVLAGGNNPPPREFPVLEPSRPIRIAIPSLDVRAPVHAVGVADDGSIAVPSLRRHNQAGWYDRGPTPGQFGPAIIVGHADTRDGPSVFHGLADIAPGATVEVTRRDRTVAIFEVNSVAHYAKDALPIEQVYGDYTRPGLRLITCGGEWRGDGIGYADNIVVFASLVEVRDS